MPESEWPPNPVYPGRAAGRIKEVLRREGVLGCEGVTCVIADLSVEGDKHTHVVV